MSRWAAIVYGRTYEVDFRFLALPHDFNGAEQNWAMMHIQTMTRLPEDLPGKPRWAVFTNDKLCVIGVACMARELGGQANTNNEDITRDQRKRPLYTFVGYATRLNDQDVVEIPNYLGQDLSLFSLPYHQYVYPNWRVKSYDERSSVAIATTYQPLSYPTIVIPADLEKRDFSLNLAEDDAIYLWRDDDEKRHYLWASAAKQISEVNNNVSLCLGLMRSSATNGAFLNVTIADVAHKEKIIRVLESTSAPSVDSTSVAVLSQPTPKLRNVGDVRDKTSLILQQVSALLIGAITGFLVARLLKLGAAKVVIYTFVGGIVTWILLLIALGVNLLIKRTSSQKLKNNESSVLSKQDRMFGFRDKTEQDATKNDDFMGWR
jgi:hypothetical protein